MRRTMTETEYAAITRVACEIALIPYAVLPSGPARTALCELAVAGVDMNVYQHAAGDWVVWLRPAERWQDGRNSLAEWMRNYAQLAADALARQAETAGKDGAA